MKKRLLQTSLLVIIFGLMLVSSSMEVLASESAFASNYDRTYTFDVQYGYYRFSHRLYTSVPPSLCDYYGNESHSLYGDGDYSKFVTPIVFESIAENIQNVTGNMPYSDEQFANAVLMLVHQLPYAIGDMKYPIETLVDNSGKCDTLSLLAASIMKAGGLDVVLLYYKELSPSHINVGVYLPYTPAYHTWWMTPTDFEYNNKTYWMAECTSLGEWKVGDRPDLLADAKPQIISLENCEESSPAQVSSSLDSPLIPSFISINLSSENSSFEESGRTLTISGSISPEYPGKSIVMYVSQNGYSCNTFRTVTDDLGNYSLTWNFTSTGTYYIRTSWSGASNYAGADSETLIVFVGPESFVQFDASDYNYIFGQASLAAYEVRPLEGVDDFLSIPLGTGVSFSYDFIILQAGHTVSNVQTETITIPGSERTISMGRNRQTKTIQIPEETITIPINVPTDMEPLRLPDDFNQTINNQFCFILQNNSGNYSLNIRGLNDYDMSNIRQGNGNNTAFMNASENIKENTWYKVTASISDNGITANLYNTDGTLIESMVTPYDAMNSNEMVMLITNNVDSAVVFKDLKVEALNNTTQPTESNKKATNDSGLLFPYVSLSILLVATFAAAVVYVKKRKKAQRPTLKQTAPINNVHNIVPVFMFCFDCPSMRCLHQKSCLLSKQLLIRLNFNSTNQLLRAITSFALLKSSDSS